jgi:hypothetical protein
MAVFQRIQSTDKIRDPKTKRLLKSSQERYRDIETGKIVSRRQRDKISKAIPKDVRIRHKQSFDTLRKSYVAKQAQKGKIITIRKSGLSDEFTKIVKDLKKGAKLKREGKTAEGNTLIRRALQKTTRRDGISRDIPPGESPKGEMIT